MLRRVGEECTLTAITFAELARGATMLIRMEGNQTLLDPPPDTAGGRAVEKKTHAFTFDKSYWSAGDRSEPRYCSQQTLYNDLGEELLDHGFAGFNACILACESYSGKHLYLTDKLLKDGQTGEKNSMCT